MQFCSLNIQYLECSCMNLIYCRIICSILLESYWNELCKNYLFVLDISLNISPPPLQNEPLPDMRYERLSNGTFKRGRRRPWWRRTIWWSSTTECPKQPVPPSPTSPMTCATRTTTMCCTSIPPKTILSCPFRIRSVLYLPQVPPTCSHPNNRL